MDFKNKAILILMLISLSGNFLYAQTDTTKKVTDSVVQKNPTNVLLDTVKTKIPSDTANYALLYVYRPKSFSGAILSYDLKLTNATFAEDVLGSVKNNSKFIVKIRQEGKTEIWAKTESKKSVFLDVRFGQKYYLKCGISMGIMVGRPDLNLVLPEQGETDFEHVKAKAQ